jgi:hypothetical protein
LQSGFLETQKEMKQLSATVASIDSSINTTINTTMQSSMEEVKQELTTQLESVFASLCTKLKIPTDDHFSKAPPKTDDKHSSHSHTFQNHHFQCDLRLPWVDVTKFDGSDPTGWVAQETHCYIHAVNNFQIMIANGGSMKCGGCCENVCLQIGDYHLKSHMFSIDMGGCDIVLGADWLRTLGPILMDFKALTMQFN